MGCMLYAKPCALALGPYSDFLSSAPIGNSTTSSNLRRRSEFLFTPNLRRHSIAWRQAGIIRV